MVAMGELWSHVGITPGGALGVVVASTLLITWREAALNRAARKVSAGEEAAG